MYSPLHVSVTTGNILITIIRFGGYNILLASNSTFMTDLNLNDISSLPEVFFKKGVLKTLAKSSGKHLCQNLHFNKVADLRPATFLTKDSGTGVFL